MRNREIARSLGMSEKTVKSHLNNMFSKTRVDSRFALTLWSRGEVKQKPRLRMASRRVLIWACLAMRGEPTALLAQAVRGAGRWVCLIASLSRTSSFSALTVSSSDPIIRAEKSKETENGEWLQPHLQRSANAPVSGDGHRTGTSAQRGR